MVNSTLEQEPPATKKLSTSEVEVYLDSLATIWMFLSIQKGLKKENPWSKRLSNIFLLLRKKEFNKLFLAILLELKELKEAIKSFMDEAKEKLKTKILAAWQRVEWFEAVVYMWAKAQLDA